MEKPNKATVIWKKLTTLRSEWLLFCSVVMTLESPVHSTRFEFSMRIMDWDSSHPSGLGLKSKLVERQNPF